MGATDVSTSVLTPADHAHFLEHGYVIVRRVVTTAVAARAAAALEAARFEGNPGQPGYKPVRGEAVDACASERMRSAIRAGLHLPRRVCRFGHAATV